MGGRLEFIWNLLGDYMGGFPENGHYLFLIIFTNNSAVSFLAMILGVFLGIFPILVIALNGIVIGVVSLNFIESHGLQYLLLGTLPHGVIEIPVFLLSAGIGLKLGYKSFRKIAFKEEGIVEEVRKGIKLFLIFILPMIFLAALIESFVTPLLIW